MATTFCNTALVFDPQSMSCDVAIDTSGRPVIDWTPATPLLIAIGCDRRAQLDDVLPYNAGTAGAPLPFNPRRGYPGDALDTQGEMIGSRLWLLHREKQTENTRQRAIAYAIEATRPMAANYGCVDVDAQWIAPRMLGLGVRVDKAATLSVPLSLG